MNHLTAPQNSEASTRLALLPVWQKLSTEEQAFVAAYVELGYSLAAVVEATGLSYSKCKRLLSTTSIRAAITELQGAVGEIDFMNERWVKEQMLLLYPKLIGEEAVPMIDNFGAQIAGKKFYPDQAIKVLEYVAPKAGTGNNKGGTNVQVNIDLGAFGIQKVEVSGG